MCLGQLGRIVSVDGLVASVDFQPGHKTIHLHVVDDDVVVGDWVLCSLGYARRKIAPEDVEELRAMYTKLTQPSQETGPQAPGPTRASPSTHPRTGTSPWTLPGD